LPDVAGKLLADINNQYLQTGPAHERLPGPSAFRAALYACFLKNALDYLQSQPSSAAADCLLQWRLPFPAGIDGRQADDLVISLLAALKGIGRDGGEVWLDKQTAALAAVMSDAVNVGDHSPARNRRLLAVLAGFPDAVCARVLSQLLADRQMDLAHSDVLFASIVEAAGRLPDAYRAGVLTAAASQLQHFPIQRKMLSTDPDTLLEARQQEFDRAHPRLQASDPELHAYLQPGCVSPMEGLTLLLDAMQTLPAPHRAGLLGLLSKRDTFFAFANGRMTVQDQLECSMRLLSRIIGLPDDADVMRAKVPGIWVEHFMDQFSGMRKEAEDRLLAMLFALSAREGRPLFEPYVDRIGYAPSKAALRQRALANWAGAD
jgi:hypothetical protein